jgi:hypothetical protein
MQICADCKFPVTSCLDFRDFIFANRDSADKIFSQINGSKLVLNQKFLQVHFQCADSVCLVQVMHLGMFQLLRHDVVRNKFTNV